jgi:hypothetical protein
MNKPHLMLFPTQRTDVGMVPAHLFTVRTDAERFDALAEGATDVTGDPAYEIRWGHECADDGDFDNGHAFDDHPFH